MSPGRAPSLSRHVVEEQWHIFPQQVSSLSAFSLFRQQEAHREFGLICKYFQECPHCSCQSLYSQFQHSTRSSYGGVWGSNTLGTISMGISISLVKSAGPCGFSRHCAIAQRGEQGTGSSSYTYSAFVPCFLPDVVVMMIKEKFVLKFRRWVFHIRTDKLATIRRKSNQLSPWILMWQVKP